METEDNPFPDDIRSRIFSLTAAIKQETEYLASSFWSAKEIDEIQQSMQQLAEDMQTMVQETIKNLSIYRAYGWKQFVPESELKAEDNKKSGVEQEKDRVENWAERFYDISMYAEKKRKQRQLQFAHLLREQVTDYKMTEMLLKHGYSELYPVRILDIGCGDGRVLRKLIDWGGSPERMVGVDVNDPILELAERLSPSSITYKNAHADDLPYADRSFDLVLLFGVIHHILDEELRVRIGRETLRVLNDGGIVMTFNVNLGVEKKMSSFFSYTTIGLGEQDLARMFPDCDIDFAPMLEDAVISQAAPGNWGSLFDRVADSAKGPRDYALAVIRKREKGC
jgi:ubiquinone/menaquinone biosynthesis C-methylase UbiE